MKLTKLMTVSACLAGAWSAQAGVRTVSAEEIAGGRYRLTFGASSGTENTVFAAYGAAQGGDKPGSWEKVSKVGTVPAEADMLDCTVPADWKKTAHNLRFFVVDGTHEVVLATEYVAAEAETISIPLEYVPTSKTRTQLKFMYTNANGSTFFGTQYGTDDNKDYRFFQGANNSIAYFDLYTARVNQDNTLTDKTKVRQFEIGNHYIKDLDTGTDIVTGPTVELPADYASTLQFFAGGDYGRIYSAKIYEDETDPVRNLVPCVTDGGSIGLYDTVEGKVYPAKGDGATSHGTVSEDFIFTETYETTPVIADVYNPTPVYTDYNKRLRVAPVASIVPKAGATHTDVPVLLRISTAIQGFSYDDLRQDGLDLLIVDEQSNELPFEVETWNPSGESLVWVKVPSFSTETKLTVYYGDKQGRRNAANEPSAVWSAYAGVWHFDELGAGGTVADATANGYTGTSHETSEGLESGVFGNYRRCIDKRTQSGQAGLYFVGTQNIQHGGKLTLSAWVKRYQLKSCWDHLFYSKTGSSVNNGFASELYGQDNAWGQINLIGGGSNGQGYRVNHGFTEADTWYHITATYDGKTATFYNNGESKGSGEMKVAMTRNGQRFSLGNNINLNGTPWDGAFDEFRVSVGAMSADRVKLEYDLTQAGVLTATAQSNIPSRPTFGDSAIIANGDGTYTVTTALTEGLASSVKLRLSDGTERELAPSGAEAGWTVSETVSGFPADLSFTAELLAVNDDGDSVVKPLAGTFYHGTVSVSTTGVAYEEGPTANTFTFSRGTDTASTAHALDINYTLSGTATAGADYEELSGTVTIPAGASSATVTVTPKINAATDEDVVVVISVGAGNFLTSSASAEMMIVNCRDSSTRKFRHVLPLSVTSGKYTGETLTDFPVLVRLTPTPGGFSYDDFERADKTDLAFMDENGTLLPYEIQTWNTEGTSLVWVKVPKFSSDTVIKVLYGALTSGRTATTDVWSFYKGVWHMDETEAGTVTLNDATATALNGTYGKNTSTASGVFGASRQMATATGKPSDQGRTYVDGSKITFDQQYVAASMWVYFLGDTSWAYLLTRKNSDTTAVWGIQIDDNNKNMRFWGDGGSSTGMNWGTLEGESKSNGFPLRTWVKLDAVYSGGNYYLYVNGAQKSTATGKNWPNGNNKTNDLSFGGPNGDSTWGMFLGQMDEVRLSANIPSADRVKAAYAVETDEAFFTAGQVGDIDVSAPALAPVELDESERNLIVTLEAGQGRLFLELTDVDGNVTRLPVNGGALSGAGLYTVPLTALPENLWLDVAVVAEGENGKHDYRLPSVTVRNDKLARIVFRAKGYAGAQVENFPALVRLTEGAGGFHYKNVREAETGGDIRFTDEAGKVLAFECEAWNPTGESLFWVKLPKLAPGAKIQMQYGTAYEQTKENIQGVWEGQTAVWHLAEGADTYFENAAKFGLNQLRGWKQNTTYKGSGIVGEARTISNGNAGDQGGMAIAISDNDALDLGDNFTVSCWICYKAGQTTGYDRILARKSKYDSTDGWELSLASGSTVNLHARGSSSTAAGDGFFATPVNDGNWHYVTAVYNGATLDLYENGVHRVQGTIDAVKDSTQRFTIGNNSAFGEVTFKGTIDEVRYGAGSLSADRIKADYETVANDAFFQAEPYRTGFVVIVH